MHRKLAKPDVRAGSTDLAPYSAKRDFNRTAEPRPRRKRSGTGKRFVMQKHSASHLHYDFRLEVGGVLKSWAVPKGPSVNPKERRLAMAVEDHPLDYAGFEGVIPRGEYGGGTVMVWDRGTYRADGDDGKDVAKALAKGALKLTLKGAKLKGGWVLVRTRGRQWLLVKLNDRFASDEVVTEARPKSVLTDRTLAEIAADEGGNVAKAKTGDPPRPARAGSGQASLVRASRSTRQRLARRSRQQQKTQGPRRSGPQSRTAAARTTKVKMPPGARARVMPGSLQPMLATLVDEPFSGADWIYETKWDGVRTICYLGDGMYRLASRKQLDVTAKYPELAHI